MFLSIIACTFICVKCLPTSQKPSLSWMGCCSVVECLPGLGEIFGSIPSILNVVKSAYNKKNIVCESAKVGLWVRAFSASLRTQFEFPE